MKQKDFKILIVEDNQAMRKLMESMLYGLGYTNLHSVGDGESAWKVIQEGFLDVVISDMLMPVMNGLELLRKIRSSKHHYSLPFIMVTGADSQSEIMFTMQAEVDHYLLKPPNVGQLDTLLKKVIKQKVAPTQYQKAITAGKFYFLNNNLTRSLKCFEAATQLQPEKPMPYYYLGLLHKKNKNDDQAIKALNQCLSLSKLYVNAWVVLAEIHARRKDDEILAKILTQIVKLLPNNFEMHRMLGTVYGRIKEPKKAAHNFHLAVKLARSQREKLKLLVEDYVEAGLFDEADDLFLRKIGEDDKNKIVLFWNRLGDCCKKRKQRKKAKYFYMSALQSMPQDRISNLNLAVLFLEDKEYGAARSYVNKIIRLFPDCPDANRIDKELEAIGA